MAKTETLNQCVPEEALAKWAIKEARRQNDRAESVATYARQLEQRVAQLEQTVMQRDGRIKELEAIIASSPLAESKAEKKAQEKRLKTLRKHLKQSLGKMKNDMDYLQQLYDFLA